MVKPPSPSESAIVVHLPKISKGIVVGDTTIKKI